LGLTHFVPDRSLAPQQRISQQERETLEPIYAKKETVRALLSSSSVVSFEWRTHANCRVRRWKSRQPVMQRDYPMAILLAERKHLLHSHVLEARLTRWCANAKNCNRFRFLKIISCTQAAPGRLSGSMIRL
jgi:hypothetical protein